MQAMILAGGDAVRLRPLNVHTPNPLVAIANRPLLKYQIEILKRAGFREMTLVLGYQPTRIEDHIGDGREEQLRIHYQVQSTTQGTAGAFRSAMGANPDAAVVLYGDILTDLRLDQMIAFHRQQQALVTIATVAVENPTNYGMIETDDDGRMTRFVEKPKPEEVTFNTINAGAYVIEPEVLKLIPAGEKYSFEEELFPRLITAGHPVYSYGWSGYWTHLGSVANYLDANLDLLAGRLSGLTLGTRATGLEGVDERSIVEPSCTIKPGARIVNSVLGPNCFVEERAVIENSVLLSGVRIGKAAEIHHSVLGKSSIIGRQARVEEAVFGDKSSLADYSIS
jgi:NDP-sugar pyrophosphorylase family protein